MLNDAMLTKLTSIVADVCLESGVLIEILIAMQTHISASQLVQHFPRLCLEFDYHWQIEIDVRYTT